VWQNSSERSSSRVRRKPWYIATLVATITSIAGAIGSYYTAKGNIGDLSISNEHRLTKLEEDFTAHQREDDRATTYSEGQFHNVWCAIHVNNGEPCESDRAKH